MATPVSGKWARPITVFLGCCLLFLAIVATASADDSSSQASRNVTVGVPQSFPPYYLLDENGNPSGFAVDTMNEVAKRAGFKVTYRVAKNGDANFKAIRAGDIDIIPSLGINDFRNQYVAFTPPVDTFRIMLFVRDDTQGIAGIDDMAGRPVAVVIDNAGYRFLEKNRPDIRLKVFPQFVDALFALLSGKVDAFAYPESVAWKLVREAGVSRQIKVAATPVSEVKRAMAVRKDRTELLAVLNQAVKEFIASPEYRKVYVAWFGNADPFWTVRRGAWAMGGATAVLLFVMVWWRYRTAVRVIRSLSANEQRFKDIAETASDWFWEMDENLTFTYFSDRYAEISNFRAEDRIGTFRMDFVPEEELKGNSEKWAAHQADLEARRPFKNFEYTSTASTSNVRQVMISGKPIFDSGGNFRGYRGTGTDITERRKAEKLLTDAIESLGAGISVWDADDRLVLSNEMYRNSMAGIEDVVVPGVKFEEIIRTLAERGLRLDAIGREEEWIAERMQLHRNPDLAKSFEIQYADGRWIENHEFPASDGGIVTVRLDITERKKSEQLFSAAFRDGPAIYTITTPEVSGSRYVDVSENWLTTMGYSREEVIGKDPNDLKIWFDPDGREKLFASLDENNSVKNFESRFRTKNGTALGVSISAQFIGAVPNNFLLLAFQDITKRQQAEGALQKSEQRLRGAVESLQESFALFDGEDRLVAMNEEYGLINPAAWGIMERGGTFEELLKANVELGRLNDAKGREEAFIRERLELHRNPKGSILRQLSDGTWHIIKETQTPEGGVAITFTDITELKRVDLARQQALAEAEQANHAKSEFLAAMSHELRTPLNAILGFADIISHQYVGPVDEKYQEYAEDIHTSGEHLLSLINDVLDISTIEAGKRDLAKETLVTKEMVAECIHIVAEGAKNKGIKLVTNLDQNPPPLHADRRAVRQILLNLLTNSIKFTPEGGRVTVSAKATNKRTTFKVADTGIGIAADKIPELTNPFTRGERDPHKTVDGWGLGLAITKSLVDLHEGKLEIKSKLGAGTTVTVTLPTG